MNDIRIAGSAEAEAADCNPAQSDDGQSCVSLDDIKTLFETPIRAGWTSYTPHTANTDSPFTDSSRSTPGKPPHKSMKGTAEHEETDHEVDLSSHGPTEHEEEPSQRESEFSKYATPSNLCVDREDLRLTSQTSAESLYDGDAEKLNRNTEQSCSPFPDIIVGRDFYLAHGVDIAQGAEGKIETNPRDSLLYKDAAVSPGKRSDNEAWPELSLIHISEPTRPY